MLRVLLFFLSFHSESISQEYEVLSPTHLARIKACGAQLSLVEKSFAYMKRLHTENNKTLYEETYRTITKMHFLEDKF